MKVVEGNWLNLVKSKPIEVKHDEDNKLEASFVIQPLENGFGLTLGNSLRRVLLSSIQGAAITGIKIDGVVHEFSTIDGVLEDVTEIILNLKRVAIDYKGETQKRLLLEKNEKGAVKAGDIQVTGDIKIANPDLHICTLSEGASIRMELFVNSGKGYVSADKNRFDDSQIGLISIDSIFSPIVRVSYKVEDTREGQVLDYDKLTIDIETDGTITPEDSLAYAARILQDQLSVFINFEDPEQSVKKEEEKQLPFPVALLKKVEELELSVRSANCLKNDNIVYIGDLTHKSENDMLRTPNFGRKSLNEIKELLAQLGLTLGKKYEGWPPEDIEDLVSRYDTNSN